MLRPAYLGVLLKKTNYKKTDMQAAASAFASAATAATTAVKRAATAAVAAAPVIAPEGKVPSEEELLNFFKMRVTEPEYYTFDPKGNLVFKEKLAAKGKGVLAPVDGMPTSIRRVYTIPPYRPYTAEEREAMDGERIDAIRAAEEKYDNALTKLRRIYGEFTAGENDTGRENVINANKAVEAADIERHAAMYAVRELYYRGDAKITTVFLRDVFDQNRNFTQTPLTLVRRSPYKLDKLYVTAGEEIMPAAPPAGAGAGGPKVGGGMNTGGSSGSGSSGSRGFVEELAKDLNIILFGQPNENEYGFLSTFYPVEFAVDGIKYFTVEQVLAAEKARLFLDDALRTRIMKTRAPRSMRTMASSIVMKPATETGGFHQIQPHEWDGPISEGILYKATLAKFQQHPELRDKLLATGSATLALADSREKRHGIGLNLGDVGAQRSENWRGSNLYGRILMKVRSQLREEFRTDNAVMSGGAGTEYIKESTVRETDYRAAIEKARTGAIIWNMRYRGANH
jgi:ribA/ribD-fused uncharacterized protein